MHLLTVIAVASVIKNPFCFVSRLFFGFVSVVRRKGGSKCLVHLFVSLHLYVSVTAANQKEALKSGFCVKEEPEAEEASSPERCPPFSLGLDAPAVPGRPRQEGSILSHDINVKVASELLMKLSGKTSGLTETKTLGPKF